MRMLLLSQAGAMGWLPVFGQNIDCRRDTLRGVSLQTLTLTSTQSLSEPPPPAINHIVDYILPK